MSIKKASIVKLDLKGGKKNKLNYIYLLNPGVPNAESKTILIDLVLEYGYISEDPKNKDISWIQGRSLVIVLDINQG